MSANSSSDFLSRAKNALANPELRSNFRGAMDFLQDKRAAVFANNDEFHALQNFGKQVRQDVIQRLPELLEQLETNCLHNGINVHWAADANEANQQILSIANESNARRVIKGKSMASEEIHMNAYMAKHGIECTESDMGEYIVQLADETPSHIIMPAIHKNKEQISMLFDEKLGEKVNPEDVDGLIDIGRRVLRKQFQEADIGVSGVNFAIADTGTLCLVENEGNGRMSTTIPNTHIAIMGLEKVVPNIKVIPNLLKLLTRSATGQTITTYINMISRPRQPDELDGPEQVHLIILDNGRSQIAQDEKLKQTLACIRCGACMNHCPVYTRIGGHAYGSTYPGPIGQVVMPQIGGNTALSGMNEHGDKLDACSLNGACGEVCPVGIELPQLIRELRSKRENDSQNAREKLIWLIWEFIHRHPMLYRLSTRTAGMFPSLISRIFPGWTRHRSTPKAAPESLHSLMKKRKKQGEK